MVLKEKVPTKKNGENGKPVMTQWDPSFWEGKENLIQMYGDFVGFPPKAHFLGW